MPYMKIDVNTMIEDKRQESEGFRQAWDESRAEYKLIGEMIEIRKQERITQSKLAEITGNKQQVISRIEKKESIPSIRTFNNILNALGYRLKIEKNI